MTDREIIQGLIERDNQITYQFFYVKCRSLLTAIMRFTLSYPVEYNGIISKSYDYLMEDNCIKLRQFQGQSTIYQWMKGVVMHFLTYMYFIYRPLFLHLTFDITNHTKA